MATCDVHLLVEEKLKAQEKQYVELSRSILGMHRMVISEIGKVNKKVEIIHTKLIGDINGNGVGMVQKMDTLEIDNISFKTNQLELQKAMRKIIPWFAVYKWSILTIAPIMISGFLLLLVGLLTGKIQIIM